MAIKPNTEENFRGSQYVALRLQISRAYLYKRRIFSNIWSPDITSRL